MSMEFILGGDKNALKLDDDDACTALHIYIKRLNCTLYFFNCAL